MLSLQGLKKRAREAVNFESLICIAAYSADPDIAYETAREFGWYHSRAVSCKFLSCILNEYGKDEFENFIWNENRQAYENICFCTCHIQRYQTDELMDFANEVDYCGCCEPEECFHAAHVFNQQCPLCSNNDDTDNDDEDDEPDCDNCDGPSCEGCECEDCDGCYCDDCTYDDCTGCECADCSGCTCKTCCVRTCPYNEEDELEEFVRTPEQRLKEIADRIQKASGTNYPVEIKQGVVSFGRTDGEKISISSRLLELSDDDDEIAFVVAHEVSHNMRNSLDNDNARRQRAIDDAFEAGEKQDGFFKSIAAAAIVGTVKALECTSMERESEYESDNDAAELAEKAGYDPASGADILEKMDPYSGYDQSLFDTHPNTRRRANRLRTKYRK